MNLLSRVLAGALSGVLSTVALTGLRKSLAAVGVVGRTAPEQVVRRLEEVGLLDGWSPGARRALVVLAHLAYGTAIGASFGALRRTVGGGGSEASAGAALGVLGWAANWAGVLPALGVHEPPWRSNTPKVLLPVVDHAFFGAVWGFLYRLLRRAAGV